MNFKQKKTSSLITNCENQKIHLTQNQEIILQWFIDNGDQGYFSFETLSKETNINYGSTRKVIDRLEKIKILEIGDYIYQYKKKEYKINRDYLVQIINFNDTTNNGQVGSSQVTGEGQVIKNSSYKERKILLNNLKNLSFFLKNSDFWKKQSLTQKRIERWMTEFDMDENFVIQQLQMAEADPKITAADDPMDYLYRCFVKTGGIKKPKHFEFPEERMARLKAESLAASESLLKKQEEIREKEKELAKKEAFLLFLQNEDAVLEGIVEIEKSHVTPKLKVEIELYKSSRKIGERLENRLKIYFESD